MPPARQGRLSHRRTRTGREFAWPRTLSGPAASRVIDVVGRWCWWWLEGLIPPPLGVLAGGCPCGRRSASLSQPASTRLMNVSTRFGNGGTCSQACPPAPSPVLSEWWSRFQSATNASWCDARAASTFAASSLGPDSVGRRSVVVGGSGDRPLGFRCWFGIGSRFQFDCRAQLGDRGRFRELRVVRVRTPGGVFGDDPDLVQ